MATNFFKTNIRKILTAVLTLALILNLSALAVSAAPNKGNNKGEGHYTVHVHLSEAVASNKDSVTITLPNGVSHTGNMQGKTLDFTFPTTDNGFSVPAGGLFVTFVTEDGQTGTMVIFNQEGNAKPNIEDEHDQGANNYRADVTVDMPEEETTEEETTEEETTEEVTTEEETTVPYWPPVETDPVVPIYPPYNPPVSETPDDVEEIDDEDVPLDSTPEEVDDSVEVSVEESDEELEEIEDEEVPLSDVPQTGSASVFYLIMTVASAIGLIGVNALKQEKKKEKEAAKPDPDADYVDDDEDYGYSEEYEEDEVDFIADDEDNESV